VAFGDSFIWAEATSGEAASRAARKPIEQNESARIDEILERKQNRRATVVGFGHGLNRKARLRMRKKEGRPEAAFATSSPEEGA
jgi:citrate synthase